MYNMDKMNKFLETQNLPRLNNEQKMWRSITSKEVESVIKNLPTITTTKKALNLMALTGEFYQTCKK